MSDRDNTTDQNTDASDTKGDDSSTEVIVQQKGEVIFPEVPDGFVEKIAEERYGLKVTRCKQFNGYDDKNYHILVSPTSSNPHVTSVLSEGYVMKVVNSMDTRRPAVLHAQIAFMQHLQSRGIPTQDAVPSLDGETVIFYSFPSSTTQGETKTHAVCLRTFLPGCMLCDVTLTRDLCYRVGEFQASMTKALEDFHHLFYEKCDHLWSMNNIPKLTEFVDCVTDVNNRRVVDEVIEAFVTKVMPRRNEIRSGYVHGDANEQNILVKPKSPSTGNDDVDYVIAGILDFQDAARTHPLYDIAINIAYIMLVATTFDPLEVGGHIIAGYTSKLTLPDVELSLLRTCVAARLVQSLVLGAYNHTLDPTNDYILTSAKRGWDVLHSLWGTSFDSLYEMWDNIQMSYEKKE